MYWVDELLFWFITPSPLTISTLPQSAAIEVVSPLLTVTLGWDTPFKV